MSVVSPRVREDSVHPRLQLTLSGRPLNFTVRGQPLSSEFRLTSVEDGSTLALFRVGGGLIAEASGAGFSVRVPVYDDLKPTLGDLFRTFQRTPRSGETHLHWENLEGELRFDATLDSVGHVYLTYELRSPGVGSTTWWSFTGRLVLELGSLPLLTKRLDAFLNVAL